MFTLYDFGSAVVQIRDLIDMIEIRGAKNAELVATAFQKCNEIIAELNKYVQSIQNREDNADVEKQNQVGDAYGTVDS